MPRSLTPEDFYHLKLVEDPAMAPDGAEIAFVQQAVDRPTYEYRRSIWLASAEHGEPRQFTAGPNDTQPRWSPDGRQLAFVRGPAAPVKPTNVEERDTGIGKGQIWVAPRDGGEPRQVTFMRHGAGDPIWSPDGKALLFTAQTGEPDDAEVDEVALEGRTLPRVRAITRLSHKLDGVGYTYELRSHLFTIALADAPDAQPRQLTDGDWDESAAAWSPDGARIAFLSDRSAERWRWPGSAIWTLDVAQGTLARLSDESLTASGPAWSPDGRSIAFLADLRRHSAGHTDLYIVAADAGPSAARILTQDFVPTCADTCVDDMRSAHGGAHLTWSADGSEIFFPASMRGTTHIYAARVTGDWLPRRLTDGSRRIYGVSFDRARKVMALAVSDPAIPGDLYIQPLAANDTSESPLPRRRTHLNKEALKDVELAKVEEFAYRGVDDWELQGWIVRPRQAQAGATAPAILEIHGGPHGMYGHSFFLEFQLLAARGYAVIYLNPRGSTGYGRIFSGAVINDWGGKDYEDLMAGVNAAIARAGIDPERLGVGGGSYGGFMTNWIVGHTQRFKAAVTMRSIAAQAPFFGMSDIGWWLEDSLGIVPWRDPERALQFSPLTYVESIRTPLLILHSDQDLRCPVGEGEQLFTALMYLGRTTRFVRFEGQSHDLSRSGHPRSRVRRLTEIVNWFERYNPLESAAEEAR